MGQDHTSVPSLDYDRKCKAMAFSAHLCRNTAIPLWRLWESFHTAMLPGSSSRQGAWAAGQLRLPGAQGEAARV